MNERIIDTARSVLVGAGVTKRYGATLALDAVDFDLHPGEVHALCGENGAGKSTLVKILSGAIAPTAGGLWIGDVPAPIGSPREAQALGIAVVHQDNQLFDAMRVWENVAVAAGVRRLIVNRSAARARVRAAIERFGEDIDPDFVVGDLAPTQRKLVEIARALVDRSRFLLLDEPTAALDPSEARRLAAVIAKLAASGTGIVLVSHQLEEVVSLADRVTVLRDGRNAGSFLRGGYRESELVRAMIGGLPSPPEPRQLRATGTPAVRVRDERLLASSLPIAIDIHRGEIVAVVGLIGSGASTLLATVAGARRATGAIEVDGRARRFASPARAVATGVGYVPADRKRAAILPDLSVATNIAISSLSRHRRAGLTSHRRIRSSAAAVCGELGVRHRSVDQPMATLSGGNQQKAVIGRWLTSAATVLAIDEPTQGVDVGARADIHEHIRRFAERGGAVVFNSSDLDEILALADRVVVLRKGTVVCSLSGADLAALDRSRLLATITGLDVAELREVPA